MRVTKMLPLILILMLCACARSGDGEPANQPTMNQAPAQSAPAQPAPPVSPDRPEAPQPAQDEGRYTSLTGSGCKTVELGDELGSTRTTCEGVKPYQLIVTDSDARQMLDVADAQGKPQRLQLAQKVSAAFSDLGATIEWWPQGEARPTALTTRFNAYEHPEQPDRPTSYLVVAKLKAGQGSCVTQVIPPGPSQNTLAREAAARAPAAACKADRY